MSKLILASGSRARQEMLRSAGVVFEVVPVEIDEAAVQAMDFAPEVMALRLAQEKALAVSRAHAGALVIGSDQILECGGQVFSKAADRGAAMEKLRALEGKVHRLISAVSVARDGEVLWHETDVAVLSMGVRSDEFWDRYADAAGDVLTSCVGAYAIEAHGAWLFDKIEGDHFTIMGMRMLGLLSYLRDEHGVLPS